MPLRQLLDNFSEGFQPEIQLILNAMVEGICGVDSQGIVTFCNDVLLRMTGYGMDELIGNSLPALLQAAHPGNAQHSETETQLRITVQRQQPIRVDREIIRQKNGTWIPVQYWVHPLPAAGVTTCLVLFQDVSEREQATAALREREERFRRILASVADVAWTSDENRRTIYISPKVESVLGYTKEEICGSGASLRSGPIHPEDFGRVNKSYRELFEKRVSFNEEYRVRRRDGTWIWIHDRANWLHEENGVLYADGVFGDITSRKKAEAELHWKTTFLEAQANSTIDGILVVGSSGRLLMHNQRFVEMFRIPAELLANDDQSKMIEYAATLVKNPQVFLATIHHLVQHPNETVRDEVEMKDGMVVDRYSAPVIDKDGIYYGRIWTFRDITLRKRNEQTLRQLSIAVEQSPVSAVITDSKGDITYVNLKFTETTGYTPEEVLGKNPRFLKSGVNQIELYRDLWSTITQGREWRGELCNRKKNGEVFWEAATIQPITDAKGAITHYLALKEDITERRRTEKELRLTKSSIELASDAVHWVDPEGRIVYVNEAACRSLGRTRDELLSLSLEEVDPMVRGGNWSKIWQQIKSQRSITLESQNVTREGKIFPVEVTANHVEFDGQEYSFAFVRDITVRRALEAELRQAHKLEGIGQLAAGIAHEINTPIQFVSDNLSFLRDSWKSMHDLLQQYRAALRNDSGVPSPAIIANLDEVETKLDLDFLLAEAPHAIEQSVEGAQRVAKIVRAMKEFSHPDSAEKTEADLNRAIESTITVARNEWKYVADVNTEFDQSLPHVVCYPGDINQVILNLLVNAAHAIKEKIKEGEKGLITIRTATRPDFAEIAVADTGTGIPETIRGRIFDPFFTTKEVGKGTGQGLSLAHTVIVKKHSGKIWFETKMDQGTTFFIHLPTIAADRA
jgi:two-component system, NtrC family, sensor kinase